jgi:protein-S-isoprenylcysteine O-methyltransferase Ste14
VGVAVLVNTLLIGLFAVQHTIMARRAFKVWWTRIIPKAAERSTFVLASSLVLILLYWQWRPITGVVWEFAHPVPRAVLWSLFAAGWGLALYITFVIDHFELFGLRQVYLYWRGREYGPPVFVERSLYKWIRHPLMAGFLLAVWATPDMSQGHLLFAVAITGYVFMGVTFEERDLLRALGENYLRYRERTPMLLPIPKKKKRAAERPAGTESA